MLNDRFVCVAVEADRPDPEVMALGRENMSYARMLPFCMFVDGDGRFLGGSDGAVTPDEFRQHLARAIANA
jgi:hypothetical protein